jgi:hypothetical protein
LVLAATNAVDTAEFCYVFNVEERRREKSGNITLKEINFLYFVAYFKRKY